MDCLVFTTPFIHLSNIYFFFFSNTSILYGNLIILIKLIPNNASTPFTLTTEKRQNRSLIQDVTPFLNNIISQYTNPLPFETEPHTVHTISLAREHCDSYLYYIRYKTLEITSSQTPFQVIFIPVKEISSGTFYRTIHPQIITLSIQDVCNTYMLKLIEFNGNQDTPLYRSSHFEELKRKSEFFEVPDLDTRIQRHDNPHYWLQ